jgi:Protein of unknown function (DUF4232)
MTKFRIKALRFGLGLGLAIAVAGYLPRSALVASSAAVTPTCSENQITVALEADSGAYSAAGNQGFAFSVINVSHEACALEGYPKLTFFPSSYKGKSIKVTNNGAGEIFSTVRPRRVIIEPAATASFGINYGDAYDQGDPDGGSCLTVSVTTKLPVKTHPYSVGFTLPLRVNFCFAGFHFGVTSIQHGPLPKTSGGSAS